MAKLSKKRERLLNIELALSILFLILTPIALYYLSKSAEKKQIQRCNDEAIKLGIETTYHKGSCYKKKETEEIK